MQISKVKSAIELLRSTIQDRSCVPQQVYDKKFQVDMIVIKDTDNNQLGVVVVGGNKALQFLTRDVTSDELMLLAPHTKLPLKPLPFKGKQWGDGEASALLNGKGFATLEQNAPYMLPLMRPDGGELPVLFTVAQLMHEDASLDFSTSVTRRIARYFIHSKEPTTSDTAEDYLVNRDNFLLKWFEWEHWVLYRSEFVLTTDKMVDAFVLLAQDNYNFN
jgi:hypothetical protein